MDDKPNIEQLVIAWLTNAVGNDWPVFGDKPKDAPDAFILVDRTGGPREAMVLDRAEILIEVYNKKSRLKASNRASAIADVIVGLEAYEQGADYFGVGAMFPTTTKVVTILTAPATLTEIRHTVPIPVVAIGGLNRGNMDILKDTAADGIAVVSAIMKAEDPRSAAEELKKHMIELREQRTL